MNYLFLTLAIIFEVIGSSCINMSNQFTKIIPSAITVIAFAACFYCFSLALKTISLGAAYALWAGLGIVLTALVSIFFFKNPMDFPAILGITLIIAGVVILNLFSKTVTH